MEEDDLRKGPRWRKRPYVRYNISSAPPQSASVPPAPSASRYSFSSVPPQSASMPPAPSASRNNQWRSPTFQPAFEESATAKQFRINRDYFHFLFKQLDEFLVSRERFLSTKEEDISRRERAVWEWEQFMDSFMTELEEQKREASFYKEKYFSLINQLDGKLSDGKDAFHESDLVANKSQTMKKSLQMNSIFPEMESDVLAQDSLNHNGASVKASKKPVRQLNAVLALQASSADAHTSKICKNGPVKRKKHLGSRLSKGSQSGTVAVGSIDDFHEGPNYSLPKDVIIGCSGTVDTCIPNAGSFSDIDNEIANAFCFKEARQPPLPEASSTSSKEKEMDVMASNQLPNPSLPRLKFKIKAENIEYSQTSPSKSQVANVQAVDKMKRENETDGSLSANMPAVNMIDGKINGDSDIDELDHVPLLDRIKISLSSELSAMDDISNTACLEANQPCDKKSDYFDSVDSLNDKVSHIPLKRKRRKTVTCSVEVALEEDAPGLLQALVEKGLKIDELKLFGHTENEDAIKLTTDVENFRDHENVISNVFSSRSILKLPRLLRPTKGAKTTYCLGCLMSLIEQTRHLHFRNWPAEWGWCRELQSFIFVFERHNRIVLERPEYGYATYFFELVPSLPIQWQVRRLIVGMKLNNYSRTSLIENKSLHVGEDLSEAEAHVLEEYGWVPNTGLGSLLNYCARVVHDKKSEEDSSEWKFKIGRLLMFGYEDSGDVLLTDLSKKVSDHLEGSSILVKVEQ
ncbi:hypothetical protein AMTRI_Chr04g186830 [Amborella trichopoda]